MNVVRRLLEVVTEAESDTQMMAAVAALAIGAVTLIVGWVFLMVFVPWVGALIGAAAFVFLARYALHGRKQDG
jgi:ABC-type phosphate transport system permease subunit